MTPAERLTNVLGLAYQRTVLGKPGADPDLVFMLHANDPEFVTVAKAELKRCASLPPQRCFISAQHAIFLRAALARLPEGKP